MAVGAALASAADPGTSEDAPAVTRTDRIERQLDSTSPDLTSIIPPPRVSARGWLVYDALSDEAIAGVDASTPRPIASLAKLMTARVVMERVALDDTITIPAAVNDLAADAARMDARAGEKWPARDLLRAMLVSSANDAAIALASHVSDGDEAAFVELMNEEARSLGLDRTEFASATGLDRPGALSTSTPIDLVALAEADLADPEIAAAMAAETITLRRPGGGPPVKLTNRNPLLGAYPGVDGVKTGFTDAAGYMLVTHHLDQVTGGDLIVATFGSSTEATRVSDSRALLDWARSLRSELRVVEAGTLLGSVPVQQSDERADVFACDDLLVTARIGQMVLQEVVVPRSLVAPIAEGDEVGEIRARVEVPGDDDPEPVAVPVCSRTTVAERSRTERLRDHAGDYRGAWRTGMDGVKDGWSSLMERAS